MKLKLLTPAQQKVYTAIATHFVEKGSAPSYQQLADRAGYSSLATVFKHVHNLEKRGMLQVDRGRIRGIKAKCCPTCGHRKANQDVSLEARKLGSKVLQILDDDEMPPKETSERLQEVIAEALRGARA